MAHLPDVDSLRGGSMFGYAISAMIAPRWAPSEFAEIAQKRLSYRLEQLGA